MYKLGFLVVLAAGVWAAAPLTIGQAVDAALRNYPAVQAAVEQAASVSSGIPLARTAYLPRADFLAQVNRATRNNVFGLLLPNPVIPGMSGPVLGTDSLTSAWGSAAGLLVSWEPFDFGLRRANLATAEAAARRAEAGTTVTRFQVAAEAAAAYLDVLATEQALLASQAGVERARVLDQSVEALANAGLRPGADAARARAELAAARTRQALSEENLAVARAALAQLTGAPAEVTPGALLALPAESARLESSIEKHPLALAQNAAVEEAQARERALARTWAPRFNLQSAVYGRGTGAGTNGSVGDGLTGLGPNVKNWAIGLTVYFPAFDFAALRAREQAEAHLEASEAAQYNRILQDLKGQMEKAQAQLDGARRVALLTPAELDAARAAEAQATARYKSGLGAVIEVAEAQRLLTQAEIDDALAKLAVWRGLLAVAAAGGNLQPFLRMAQ